MAHAYWPLFDIIVRTPRLELRYPDDATLYELTAVVARGIHDPAYMPFLQPWTRASSPQLERNALAHWWGRRASWQPDDWHFTGVVLVEGKPVGVQDLHGERFAVTKAVSSGSWLGRVLAGVGSGRVMR